MLMGTWPCAVSCGPTSARRSSLGGDDRRGCSAASRVPPHDRHRDRGDFTPPSGRRRGVPGAPRSRRPFGDRPSGAAGIALEAFPWRHSTTRLGPDSGHVDEREASRCRVTGATPVMVLEAISISESIGWVRKDRGGPPPRGAGLRDPWSGTGSGHDARPARAGRQTSCPSPKPTWGRRPPPLWKWITSTRPSGCSKLRNSSSLAERPSMDPPKSRSASRAGIL